MLLWICIHNTRTDAVGNPAHRVLYGVHDLAPAFLGVEELFLGFGYFIGGAL